MARWFTVVSVDRIDEYVSVQTCHDFGVFILYRKGIRALGARANRVQLEAFSSTWLIAAICTASLPLPPLPRSLSNVLATTCQYEALKYVSFPVFLVEIQCFCFFPSDSYRAPVQSHGGQGQRMNVVNVVDRYSGFDKNTS